MGKSSKPTIGYWYRVAYHHGLTTGPIDAFLEFRGGDKTAWAGEVTASGTISIDAPYLWGGEKDQGGIVGDIDLLFGEAAQAPNAYLKSVFGEQVPAWRGFTTLVFKGGRYGAMNPYPQKPSYKFRRIKNGWDNDTCWYPERAVISSGSGEIFPAQMSSWRYLQIGRTDAADYSAISFDDSAWPVGTAPFGSWQSGYGPSDIAAGAPDGLNSAHAYDARFAAKFATPWTTFTRLWLRSHFYLSAIPDGTITFTLFIEDHCTVWVNGVSVISTPADHDSGTGQQFTVASSNLVVGDNVVAIRCDDEAPGGGISATYVDCIMSADVVIGAPGYANPAHVLYESRTCDDMGREPTAVINDASLRAAADKLYAEGFGICPKYDPASESIEDFEKRICKLIGGSFSRSLVDGLWYLDLARGDYVLADLPILTDDDILEFKEQPTILDNAINSGSVKYFDPEKKQTIVTPPVRAMALVASFGTIHQTNEYPEIPTGDLATRIALRDLLTTATPTRGFDLTTTRRPYSWRPGQYFRLQSPKRGIADMVCIVGDIQSGQLKSGAIKLKATQDIYSLPATSFVQVEPGVDTRPPQTPLPIVHSAVFEAPYIEVVSAMSRADLAVLPPETGFAVAVAASPSSGLDFTMMVDPGTGTYVDVGRGEWAATAVAFYLGMAPFSQTDTILPNLALSGSKLDRVTPGMALLWDSEICVTETDASTGSVRIRRGCADTVPAVHESNSFLWFYEVGMAYDSTEFTAGETINVKLLSNTGSQQLPLDFADPIALTFDQRQYRPYAPGMLRISDLTTSDASYPTDCVGELTITWAHRDRIAQADQLVDASMASIGPEAGTTYTVRYYLNNVLDHTESGIAGTAAAPYTLSGDGVARVEVWSERDGVESWQAATSEFDYRRSPFLPYVDEGGNFYTDELGNKYVG